MRAVDQVMRDANRLGMPLYSGDHLISHNSMACHAADSWWCSILAYMIAARGWRRWTRCSSERCPRRRSLDASVRNTPSWLCAPSRTTRGA